MIRHLVNSNLTLHQENNFLTYHYKYTRDPSYENTLTDFIKQCHALLINIIECLRLGLTFGFRLPLTRVISHNRQLVLRENKYAHDTVVRYVWTREVGQHGRPQYHLVIHLKYDAFCSLGQYTLGRDNMFNRLQSAWASALGLIIDDAVGLVEIPAKPYYHIHRDDVGAIATFFYGASYLCMEMAAMDLALVEFKSVK